MRSFFVLGKDSLTSYSDKIEKGGVLQTVITDLNIGSVGRLFHRRTRLSLPGVKYHYIFVDHVI